MLANKTLVDFMQKVAHDLRSPILSLGMIVKSGVLDDSYQGLFSAEINNSLEMLKQLSDFARGGSTTSRPNFLPVDLNEIINEHVPLILHRANQKGLQAQFKLAEDLPLIMGNPSLLSRVINNLAENAIKYTEEGFLKISTRKLRDHVEVQVMDSGIGIPKSDQNSLFQKNYRASNVGEIYGTGLGLQIVKELVELHKGEISIDSKENVGTSISLIFPTRTY